jgi:hypothetical protein
VEQFTADCTTMCSADGCLQCWIRIACQANVARRDAGDVIRYMNSSCYVGVESGDASRGFSESRFYALNIFYSISSFDCVTVGNSNWKPYSI